MTEFMLNSQYDTFLKDEIKLLPNTIVGIKTIGDLTTIVMFGNKTDKHLEKLVDGLLKSEGHMTTSVRNVGNNNYIPPKYVPGTPIYVCGIH